MSRLAPIGVLDSGLGGISVLRALRQTLPAEDFVYCADCGNAPWGDRTQEFILGRVRAMIHFMVREKNVKAVVLACNTATAVAAETMRKEFKIPVIGTEPAIKPAVKATKTGHVAVIATTRTITSDRYESLVKRFANGVKITSLATPGLMDCVERGEFETPRTLQLLHRYLDPLFKEKIDTLVLGCTHYPFLENAIRKIAPYPILIIDPSLAIAKVTMDRVAALNALAPGEHTGKEVFYVASATHFAKTLTALWPTATDIQELTV